MGNDKVLTLINDRDLLSTIEVNLLCAFELEGNKYIVYSKNERDYDENIIAYIKDDIKNFMEDINTIDSIHMSNLITEITNKYSESIKFFEFIDMNGYGTGEQHLYAMPMPDDVITPELINVNTLDDLTPDINIIIA